MEEVRRPDDRELCGYVDCRDGVWFALVVFGLALVFPSVPSGPSLN